MSDSPVPRRYLMGISAIDPEDDEEERRREDAETRCDEDAPTSDQRE